MSFRKAHQGRRGPLPLYQGNGVPPALRWSRAERVCHVAWSNGGPGTQGRSLGPGDGDDFDAGNNFGSDPSGNTDPGDEAADGNLRRVDFTLNFNKIFLIQMVAILLRPFLSLLF